MKIQGLLSIPLLLAVLTSEASVATHYIDLNCTNPVSPYTSWATAATNIQDAASPYVSGPGDTVIVTNWVYRTGGYTNGSDASRVALGRNVVLQSVNGPLVTVIEGAQVPGTITGPGALRCVSVPVGGTVIGFTLANGATTSYGGGVYGTPTTTISNCIIVGNFAANGGGAANGTLYNCSISSNSASSWGGGAYSATLYNCTLSGNFATNAGGGAYQCSNVGCMIISNAATSRGGGGGGAYDCQLDNCCLVGNSATFQGGGLFGWGSQVRNCTIVANTAGSGGGMFWGLAGPLSLTNVIAINNSATNGPNYLPVWDEFTLVYCCTTPVTGTCVNSFTNDPLFVDPASGNFHLQSNSPCINAGNNLCVTNAFDLDGNPRIVAGTVDIGAYEFQNPASVISYAWLQQYGLATDGSADFMDSDGDGMNNWEEWLAGTVPTNPASVLALSAPVSAASGITLSWQSVTNRAYYLQRCTNLSFSPAFLTIRSNLSGQPGFTSFLDSSATNGGPYFYRVGIQ